jgi:biopolymer transport protein ExbD
MGVRLRTTSTAAGTLNLTSMIDVVFLLLIFFLVASRFAQEERTMPIELPNAASAVQLTQRPREIVVEIDRQGKMLLDGVEATLDDLEQAIVRAAADNPTTQNIIVRSDRRTELQVVVNVIDLCSRLGAEHALVMQELQ